MMKEINKQKVNLISLGCAKNLVDSEILAGGLKQSSILMTDEPEEADTIIVNTCGFLDQARDESIDVILEAAALKSTGNLKQLVVMGCFSQRYPEELRREIPEVDRFFGTNDHRQIVSFLTGHSHSKDDPLFWRSLMTPGHYAYLKIAEGCDNGCSFCSIPLMRGLQKSRSIPSIIDETRRLVAKGVKELLVIAQDTTSYGWDLPGKIYLGDLLKELDQVEGNLEWIRLHYAHPAHLSEKTIQAMAESKKNCRYLDMPIQHASDPILKSMKRGLGRKGILERIGKLRTAIPEIRLRTTVIVGYPGETEDDFRQLYDFIETVEFDRLGVFTYSEEEETLAAKLEDNISREVKDDRKARILDLQNDINHEKNKKLINTEMKIIIDEVKDGEAIGRTEFDSPEIDNTVRIKGMPQKGEFVKVRITDTSDYELFGELI